MEPHEKVNKRTKKQMLLDNFLGGISWALGVWVGTTIIIALVVFLASKVNYIPIVGNFVSEVSKFVQQNNPTP